MKKRFLSMLLAVAMALTIVPSRAAAAALDPDVHPDQPTLETHELGPVEQNDSASEGIIYYRFEADEFPTTMSVGLGASQAFTGTTYYEQLDDASKAVYDVLKTSLSSETTTSVDFNGTAAAKYLVSKSISYTHTKVSDGTNTYDQITANNGEVYVTSSGALDEWLYPLVASAYLALTNDHPEMPWIRAGSYGWSYSISAAPTSTDTQNITGKDDNKSYTYTTEVYENVVVTITKFNLGNTSSTSKATFEDAVNTAVTEVNKILDIQSIAGSREKTRYEIVKAIHDHVCRLITYDLSTSSPFNQTAYSGLVAPHRTVCAGYAKSFKVLCDRYEIPCVLVSGQSKNSQGNFENHEWNAVKMEDGRWYGVDCTWDDQSTIYYDYLLSGSTTVATHFNSDAFNVSHLDDGEWAKNVTFAYPDLSAEKYEDPNNKPDFPEGVVEILIGNTDVPKAKAGDTLRAEFSVASTATPPADIVYNWYRVTETGRSRIAEGSEYTVTNADSGYTLLVQVTSPSYKPGPESKPVSIRKPLTAGMVQSVTDFPAAYNGKNCSPTVVVTDADKTLSSITDYTVK